MARRGRPIAARLAVVTVYGSLGDLSDAQLQAVLDRFGLGRFVSAEPFAGGLFGKNVGLTTDVGRWVLRGDPWPAHSDEQFRHERFWTSVIRDRCEVPVPWPFHIEADESPFGWPYQLTPWMPGAQERNAVGAAALGRAAAELRRITFDTFGSWSPQTGGIAPVTDDPVEWLRMRTQRWIDACSSRSAPLVESDLAFVHSLLPEELEVVPTYLHHDLKTGNCVFADGAVSGLFDLGEGTTGDPLEDLARPTWDLAHNDPTLVGAFLREYESAAGVRVPLDRLRDYILLDLLVIWEFGTRPPKPWFAEPTFELWAATFMSPVDVALEPLLDDA
jgi:hygromycin-B 7''-O-kinase